MGITPSKTKRKLERSQSEQFFYECEMKLEEIAKEFASTRVPCRTEVEVKHCSPIDVCKEQEFRKPPRRLVFPMLKIYNRFDRDDHSLMIDGSIGFYSTQSSHDRPCVNRKLSIKISCQSIN